MSDFGTVREFLYIFRMNIPGTLYHINTVLSLPMLRLLPSKALGRKDCFKPSKPCHVGIHWIALAEYSQMSNHVPGFESLFRFSVSLCNGQISHLQHKG